MSKRVITTRGRQGVLPNGSGALFNEQGNCDTCCNTAGCPSDPGYDNGFYADPFDGPGLDPGWIVSPWFASYIVDGQLKPTVYDVNNAITTFARRLNGIYSITGRSGHAECTIASFSGSWTYQGWFILSYALTSLGATNFTIAGGNLQADLRPNVGDPGSYKFEATLGAGGGNTYSNDIPGTPSDGDTFRIEVQNTNQQTLEYQVRAVLNGNVIDSFTKTLFFPPGSEVNACRIQSQLYTRWGSELQIDPPLDTDFMALDNFEHQIQ